MRSRHHPIAAILLLSLTASVPCGAAEPLGLYVRDGVVFRGGKPYRGIGANYFSLFSRRLKDPSDTSYRAGLKQLSEAGVPFVRFMCGGFWPIDCELYLRDKRALFEELTAAIEAGGVPLAAFRVFDYPQQNKTWNVTFDNRRAYMLEMIGRTNARIGRPRESADVDCDPPLATGSGKRF